MVAMILTCLQLHVENAIAISFLVLSLYCVRHICRTIQTMTKTSHLVDSLHPAKWKSAFVSELETTSIMVLHN